jgi:hypothetical protein
MLFILFICENKPDIVKKMRKEIWKSPPKKTTFNVSVKAEPGFGKRGQLTDIQISTEQLFSVVAHYSADSRLHESLDRYSQHHNLGVDLCQNCLFSGAGGAKEIGNLIGKRVTKKTGLKGFEPLTYGLRVRRSSELSYKPANPTYINGFDCEINLLITSLMASELESGFYLCSKMNIVTLISRGGT